MHGLSADTKKQAVFFDLDGTILAKPNCTYLYLKYLWKQKHVSLTNLIKFILLLIRSFLGIQIPWLRRSYFSYDPFSATNFLKTGRVFAQKIIVPKIDKSWFACVQQYKKQGGITVLLTGAPAVVAVSVARCLDIDYCIATKFYFRDNKVNFYKISIHPHAESKLSIARKFCQRNNIDLSNCIAYGNSIHDAPLLLQVKVPKIIVPDRKLKRLSNDHKWQISWQHKAHV